MTEASNQLVPEPPAAVRYRGGEHAMSARGVAARRIRVRARGLHLTWSAFWQSRLLVWIVGAIGFLTLGAVSSPVRTFDPTRLSLSFGTVGNVLAAPAVRWDAIWYLRIAHDGYRVAGEARFFPLYPLLIRVGSWLTASTVIAGVLVSTVSMFVALELIRRLTELELGAAPAQATTWFIAFGPVALFLSAVYSESLFLALSTATFYAARRGRWAWAGALGGLAAMTRIGGFLLFPAIALLYYYGPRSDAEPTPVRSWWKPRYRADRNLLWLVLIPAAAALVPMYMMLRGLGPAATLDAQEKYSNHAIVFPLVTAWHGMLTAWHQLLNLQTGVYGGQELLQFGALVVGCVALVGVFRRLPFAYGAYVALDFLLHLSTPTISDPLLGFDRYTSMCFPLFMWLGAWACERRLVRPLLGVSIAMLIFFTLQFATWHWVGTPAL
jgi:hypothetical protein